MTLNALLNIEVLHLDLAAAQVTILTLGELISSFTTAVHDLSRGM